MATAAAALAPSQRAFFSTGIAAAVQSGRKCIAPAPPPKAPPPRGGDGADAGRDDEEGNTTSAQRKKKRKESALRKATLSPGNVTSLDLASKSSSK